MMVQNQKNRLTKVAVRSGEHQDAQSMVCISSDFCLPNGMPDRLEQDALEASFMYF